MAHNIEYLKLLPLVEVSFQDQFCGCEDEITKTPQYILEKLIKLGMRPKIGDKMLLWEKDVDGKNQYYYLCNIGEVMDLDDSEIRKYLPLDSEIPWTDLLYLQSKPIIVKVDKEAYFDLPLSSAVFANCAERKL